MTEQEWKNLALFAGVECIHHTRKAEHDDGRGQPDMWCAVCDTSESAWRPDIHKSDFFDVWSLIERWLDVSDPTPLNSGLITAINTFERVRREGTDREIMEAGCALGAAIGATMGEST